MGIGHYFQHSLSAAVLGVAKPDARIFHAAAAALQVQPHEVLHLYQELVEAGGFEQQQRRHREHLQRHEERRGDIGGDHLPAFGQLRQQRLRQQVFSNLIDEKLQIQEAKAADITIDENLINDQFARLAARFKTRTGHMFRRQEPEIPLGPMLRAADAAAEAMPIRPEPPEAGREAPPVRPRKAAEPARRPAQQ